MKIRQIITNVLSNAIKYTNTGMVSISFKKETLKKKDFVMITVQDTGIGIKSEDYNKLFKSFSQLDKEKNSNIVGTGLGLYVTKGIVDMMGGTITFESIYEQGTTFFVRLPIVTGDKKQVSEKVSVPKVIAKPNTKVLVVDDNSINLTVAVGFLKNHKIEAETALSGERAIALASQKDYDLIFMDHMMPATDGIEATLAIRKIYEMTNRKYVPILALTANVVSGAKELFLSNKMDDFLSKPIDADELNAKLAQYLPKDKFTVDTPDTKSSVEDSNPVLLKLKEVKYLNIPRAMNLLSNDIKLYVMILRQFCRNIENQLQKLSEFLGGSDLKNYQILIHALKSEFASIGAIPLSTFAKNLESTAEKGNIKRLYRFNEQFFAFIFDFKLKLEQTNFDKSDDTETKETHTDLLELKITLESLKEACELYMSSEADKLITALKTYHYPENISELMEKLWLQVDFVDYDNAVDTIDSLLENL
jgi:CheY-like chemotaxis protein/HPt (histidine-containing phosphotransfer) domain-containing protein